MRRLAFLLPLYLLVFSAFLQGVKAGGCIEGEEYALIVADPGLEERDNGVPFSIDVCDKLYQILTTQYSFKSITYLKGSSVTKANVRSAISDLVKTSTRIDFVFIFIICHGGGWDKIKARQYPYDDQFVDCRVEENSDEGMEANEAMFYPDGDPNKWYGIDESLKFTGSGVKEIYWDDEFASDLSGLNCWRLALVLSSCAAVNSTEHCFSGGLIDDLSKPNRIIITTSNETSSSHFHPYRYDNWDDLFISAFDKYSEDFNRADVDEDDKVSFKEAFDYAKNYSYSTTVRGDTPWLDDDGDLFPTFVQGEDYLDYDDGQMASETFLNNDLYFWIESDINGDGCVNVKDAVLLGAAFGSKEGDPDWNPDCDLNDDGVINIKDAVILQADFGL